jgi:hypothetical protein
MPDELDPWTRLAKKCQGLFDPVDPRGRPPETPDELKEWTFNVSAVVTVCMAYSGAQEYRHLNQEPVLVPKHLPPALHDIYLRNQQSGRVAKVASRSLAAGWHALLFGGLFFGLDEIAAVARDDHDKSNTALSGLVTGALYGAQLPGGITFKVSRAGLGAAMGALAGVFVGWLHHDIIPSLDREG